MLSYNKFIEFYYRHGKCINNIIIPTKSLNDQQLKSKYDKYKKSEEHKLDKAVRDYKKAIDKKQELFIDEAWENLKINVKVRDENNCRLLKIISFPEYNLLNRRNGILIKTLEVAHVLSRGAYPELKYEIDNLVLINKFSHQMLDLYRHPITGDNINREDQIEWWCRILGMLQIERLKKISKIKNIGDILNGRRD